MKKYFDPEIEIVDFDVQDSVNFEIGGDDPIIDFPTLSAADGSNSLTPSW